MRQERDVQVYILCGINSSITFDKIAKIPMQTLNQLTVIDKYFGHGEVVKFCDLMSIVACV